MSQIAEAAASFVPGAELFKGVTGGLGILGGFLGIGGNIGNCPTPA